MKKNIGFHISIAGGLDKAIDRAVELKINAMQIFLKNSNRWSAPQYQKEDIEKFKDRWSAYSELTISAHTGYLINLAGEGENHKKSITLLVDEMNRASQLGIKNLVLHPGSHKESGIDAGIKRIASSLDSVFKEVKTDVDILLETTAGQGSSVGHKFEHIRDIIDKSKFSQRLGVCLDTCHIFAAGYDISTEANYSTVIDEFQRVIGLERLKLIHLNDSKKVCGSKADRHEHIGLGAIGNDGIASILNDDRFNSIDYIMETPDDETRSDMDNLEAVISLLKK